MQNNPKTGFTPNLFGNLPRRLDASKDSSRSRRRLATAVRNINATLQFAVDVHQAPLVLPVLARRVVDDLPGLVKGFEPALSLACAVMGSHNV